MKTTPKKQPLAWAFVFFPAAIDQTEKRVRFVPIYYFSPAFDRIISFIQSVRQTPPNGHRKTIALRYSVLVSRKEAKKTE